MDVSLLINLLISDIHVTLTSLHFPPKNLIIASLLRIQHCHSANTHTHHINRQCVLLYPRSTVIFPHRHSRLRPRPISHFPPSLIGLTPGGPRWAQFLYQWTTAWFLEQAAALSARKIGLFMERCS